MILTRGGNEEVDLWDLEDWEIATLYKEKMTAIADIASQLLLSDDGWTDWRKQASFALSCNAKEVSKIARWCEQQQLEATTTPEWMDAEEKKSGVSVTAEFGPEAELMTNVELSRNLRNMVTHLRPHDKAVFYGSHPVLHRARYLMSNVARDLGWRTGDSTHSYRSSIASCNGRGQYKLEVERIT